MEFGAVTLLPMSLFCHGIYKAKLSASGDALSDIELRD